MKKQQTEKWFEKARSLPAEVSLSQVEVMVVKLPHLPGGKGWTQWFNLTSITMSSILITIALVTAYLWQPTQPISEHQPISQEIMQPEKVKPVPPVEAVEPIHPLVASGLHPESSSARSTDITPTQQETPVAEAVLQASSEAEPMVSTAAMTSRGFSPLAPVSVGPSQLTQVVPARMATGNYYGVNLDTDKTRYPLGKMKRELLRKLKKDGLISSAKEEVRMAIGKERMLVNGEPVPGGLAGSYYQLMRKWGVKPGPNKQIRINPDVIMVGDFTPDGFSGGVKGSIDLREVGPYDQFGGVLDVGQELFLSGNKSSDGFLVSSHVETDQGQNSLRIEGSGRWSLEDDAEGNATIMATSPASGQASSVIVGSADQGSGSTSAQGSSSSVIMGRASQSTASARAKGQGKIVQFQRDEDGVLVGHIGDGEIKEGAFSREVLQSLRQELLDEALEDGLIQSRKEKLTIWFQPSSMHINGNYWGDGLPRRYPEILLKHGVKAGQDRVIMVDQEVILVGDYPEAGFTGTAAGKKATLHVTASKGSIFINDMKIELDNLIRYHRTGRNKLTGHVGDRVLRDGQYSADQLQVLRKALVEQCLEDDLIQDKDERLIIWFQPSSMRINNQYWADGLPQRYPEILLEHGVRAKNDRMILIDQEVILVGDYEKEGFTGTAAGKKTTLYVSQSTGSIFINGMKIELDKIKRK